MVSSYYNHHYNKLGQNSFIALGGDSNFESITINAENLGVGATQEDIWSPGGELSYLSSAETMDISSADVNDTNSSGTGARTVYIVGLDNNFDEVSETVNLNGTTSVTTINSYIRVRCLAIMGAGSGGKNAGIISAIATTAATTQAEIPIGYNKSVMSHYTVPNGKTALVQDMNASVPIKKSGGIDQEDILMHLEVRGFGGVFQKAASTFISYSSVNFNPPSEIPLPAKTDIKIVGIRVDLIDVQVTCNSTLLIVDNSIIT